MSLVQDFLEWDHCPNDCPGKMVIEEFGMTYDTHPPMRPLICDVCGTKGCTSELRYPRVVSREVEK